MNKILEIRETVIINRIKSEFLQFYKLTFSYTYFPKLYTFIDTQKEKYKMLGELVETIKHQGGMGASEWLYLDFVMKSNGNSNQVFVYSFIPAYFKYREELINE